jgi:hypothetical protein
VKTTLEETRSLVAGAMRWTLAHPFYLPEEALETVKILGSPLDVENASIVDFGAEDGLFYVGYEEDLEKALKDVTLDEFLAREDVDYEFIDDEDDDLNNLYDDEAALDGDPPKDKNTRAVFGLADDMVRTCVSAVRRWCAEKGLPPVAELELAAQMHVASTLSVVVSVGLGTSEEEAREKHFGLMQHLINSQGGEMAPVLIAALAQIRDCPAADADHLINAALDRRDNPAADTIDVPLENAQPTEPPCSTPATPGSPSSSSNTPAP